MSLDGRQSGRERMGHANAAWNGGKTRRVSSWAAAYLWEGAACWRTIRMMSSGVESASPLRP
jgi:hypothetical protein